MIWQKSLIFLSIRMTTLLMKQWAETRSLYVSTVARCLSSSKRGTKRFRSQAWTRRRWWVSWWASHTSSGTVKKSTFWLISIDTALKDRKIVSMASRSCRELTMTGSKSKYKIVLNLFISIRISIAKQKPKGVAKKSVLPRSRRLTSRLSHKSWQKINLKVWLIKTLKNWEVAQTIKDKSTSDMAAPRPVN